MYSMSFGVAFWTRDLLMISVVYFIGGRVTALLGQLLI